MKRLSPSSILLFAAMACASQSRLAPMVPLSDSISPSDLAGSLVVPYPAPPAKVEVMPPAPIDPNCVYLDGQWAFGARDWEWTVGTWLVPQPGCAFARSRLFWQTAGADRSELRFRPGRWVKAKSPTLDCPPATTCPGTTSNTIP